MLPRRVPARHDRPCSQAPGPPCCACSPSTTERTRYVTSVCARTARARGSRPGGWPGDSALRHHLGFANLRDFAEEMTGARRSPARQVRGSSSTHSRHLQLAARRLRSSQSGAKRSLQGRASRMARKRWAWLLAHVFQADLDTCPRCGGPMRWVEAATTRKSAARLLRQARARTAASTSDVPVP
jgi:hypothetical protein